MKLSDLAKKRIRLSYSIALSLLIVITGVLFAISCYSINLSGEHPFTVESVSLAFDRIKIPVFITLAALIGSVALHFMMPAESCKLKPWKMSGALLEKLEGKLKWDTLSEEQKHRIEKEKRLRRILKRVMTVLLVLSAVLPLIYLLNPNNFPAEEGEYNSEILHGMIFYVLSLCPLFIYSLVYGFVTERSVLRETQLVKEAIKAYGTAVTKEGNNTRDKGALISYVEEREKPILLGLRIAIFGAAAVFIVVGIVSGGAESVLAKAVKICTECIGLG